ncbi:MAG: hypothetical protein V1738_00405 [Patescibacteria group bacterium]
MIISAGLRTLRQEILAVSISLLLPTVTVLLTWNWLIADNLNLIRYSFFGAMYDCLMITLVVQAFRPADRSRFGIDRLCLICVCCLLIRACLVAGLNFMNHSA